MDKMKLIVVLIVLFVVDAWAEDVPPLKCNAINYKGMCMRKVSPTKFVEIGDCKKQPCTFGDLDKNEIKNLVIKLRKIKNDKP